MPTARRHAKPPKLSSTPRSGVSQPVARKVDAILKDLRTCSRQLSTSQPCLSDEMRVLERLYYKGVNQHRSAKFWKRVQDIRKCCKRVTEVDLLSFVDDLRYAFYANDATDRNPKILKSAWQQVPDAKYARYYYERAVSSRQLLVTCKERFAKAYHSFILMMRTGAFLQLIVVLSALVSRLNALVTEMIGPVDTLSKALRSFLDIHDGNTSPPPSTLDNGSRSKTEIEAVSRPDEEDLTENLAGEDFGSKIVRKVSTDPEVMETETLSLPMTVDETFKASLVRDVEMPSTNIVANVVIPKDTSTGANSKKRPLDKPEKMEKAKKKKKRDEIDDIFAML